MFFFFISVFTISQSASAVWYYTTLKRSTACIRQELCFSTLWNYTTLKRTDIYSLFWLVSVPYEITLLSNIRYVNWIGKPFQYLMKLHYSQTRYAKSCAISLFQYLMKLHYSQTLFRQMRQSRSFSTLWNYTTLKHELMNITTLAGFSTLWNYTTLKRF